MAFFTGVIALMVGLATVEERPGGMFISFRDAFLSQRISRLVAYRFTCHLS
jgi:hypothetical protein